MEVKVVHTGPIIAAMKTDGTRDCSLCMAECIGLFNDFHKQNLKTPKTQNLLNARKEVYSAYSCCRRFLLFDLIAIGMCDLLVISALCVS